MSVSGDRSQSVKERDVLIAFSWRKSHQERPDTGYSQGSVRWTNIQAGVIGLSGKGNYFLLYCGAQYMCCSYSSVTIKHYDEATYRRKFICTYYSRGIRIHHSRKA